jgi:hypothetical protein
MWKLFLQPVEIIPHQQQKNHKKTSGKTIAMLI